MASGGYFYWATNWFTSQPQLDSRTLSAVGGPDQIGWTVANGLVVVPTFAGTHVLQRPYYGADAPEDRRRVQFSVGMLCDDYDDYRAFARAAASGAAVYWWPSIYTTEVFEIAAGSTYKLTRPVAWTLASGVSNVTHPLDLYLDGVSDSGAATVSGQTVTAVKTGTLEINYSPIFKVVVLDLAQEVLSPNQMRISATLEEVITI